MLTKVNINNNKTQSHNIVKLSNYLKVLHDGHSIGQGLENQKQYEKRLLNSNKKFYAFEQQ